MRRRIKRSSLFTMVAIVALLSLGIGYAAWTSTLVVTGTVNTANANVEWDEITAVEVADGIAASTCDVTTGAAANPTSVAWTINGAYPGYSCTITTTAINNGDVPMQVQSKVFSPDLVATATPGVFTVQGVPGITWDFTGCAAPTNVGDELGVGATAVCAGTVTFDEQLAEDTDDIQGSVTVVYELAD